MLSFSFSVPNIFTSIYYYVYEDVHLFLDTCDIVICFSASTLYQVKK